MKKQTKAFLALAILVIVIIVSMFVFNGYNNAKEEQTQAKIAAQEKVAQQLSLMIDSFSDGVIAIRKDREGLSQLCNMAERSKDQVIGLDAPPALKSLKIAEEEFFQSVIDYCRQRTRGVGQVRRTCYRIVGCASQTDNAVDFQFNSNDSERMLNKIEKVYQQAFAKKSGKIVLIREPMGSSANPVRYSSNNDFVIYDSGVRYLEENDLVGKSASELNIARNEIYARHGRPFAKAVYRNYFRSKSWYREDLSYNDSLLSSIESRNAAFIKEYHDRYGFN